jgi:hypothetical protein
MMRMMTRIKEAVVDGEDDGGCDDERYKMEACPPLPKMPSAGLRGSTDYFRHH